MTALPATASAADHAPPSPRFLGVFFTDWLVDLVQVLLRRRLDHAAAPLHARPLVVSEERSRTHHILACNGAAAQAGVRLGMTLSQAEAICPVHDEDACAVGGDAVRPSDAASGARDFHGRGFRAQFERLRAEEPEWSGRIVSISPRLIAIRHDPILAARMLVRLGRCLERWIPVVSVPPELQHLVSVRRGQVREASETSAATLHADWIVGEFTGCADLFRGRHATEQGLMRRIGACFERHGFRVQMATASTIGAASALSRFAMDTDAGLGRQREKPKLRDGAGHRRASRFIAVPRGDELRYLDRLPLECLRIAPAAVAALRSVEVETVGQLAALGRGGVAARLSGRHADGAGSEAASHVRRSGRSGAKGPGAIGKGPRRSRHVASTGSWHETPLLFARPMEPPSHGATDPMSASRPRAWLREADDVLLRLDQALGKIPEVLEPLRIREPVVVRHAFEAPCNRPDVISRVCSDMVDRVMERLSRRREALRSAAWSFVHSDLPADLSTDLPIIALPGDRHLHEGPSPAGHPADYPAIRGRPSREPLVSSITLGLASPTAHASHVWSVLRTRLEQLALDHGVEQIECRVERTVFLRFKQARLDGGSGTAMPACPARDLAGGRFAGRGSTGRGSMGRGSTGSESTGRESTSSESTSSESTEPQQARAAWIDLVSSRLGSRAVQHPSSLVSQGDEPPDGHHPHVLLQGHEPARLYAGADGWAMAHSIATRTPWHRVPTAGDAESHAAALAWRGARWSVEAIDGWERRQHPWWDEWQEREGREWREWTAPSCRSSGNAAAIVPRQGGGVFSRLAIVTCRGRLWIWVRWPDRLPSSRPPPATHPVSVQPASVVAGPSPCDAAEKFNAGVWRWLEGGSASLAAGIDMEVRGMWG